MQPMHTTCARLLAALSLTLLAGSGHAGQQPESFAPTVRNLRPDGTYVLTTNDPRSIQAYYRDVGMVPLHLAGQEDAAGMRETCLLLGAAWQPLGHINLPDSKGGRPYRLDLCYYTAPNPDDMARAKCANLGMGLRTNRRLRHEVVCQPRQASRATL